MDIQKVLVLLVFLLAVAYVGRMIYRSFAKKSGCGSSCNCGIDFSNVEPKEKLK
ncbi:FeoB-associated Cys-rich membrane protein [Pseudopedobacter beijingensis]|uniref:FeoB-associated Cys-rich membrane protein n=1 Tax=Pseudopedobacter beijingensis TaxID=1207056 RepID=A0ABW4I8P9_9SPHI